MIRGGLVCTMLFACRSHPAEHRDLIPTTTAAIKLDGELDEPDWSGRTLRHVLVADDHKPARPYSEAFLLHDDRYVYLGLYAADEDIRTGEYFDVRLGGLAFHADATGVVTPNLVGIRTSIDRDGTLDDPSNDDEEWVLELAIPLAATGLGANEKALMISRCDTPKDRIRRCGAWTTEVSLAP